MDHKKEVATFNVVIHKALKILDVSPAEFCLIDSIDRLSSGDSPWCYASKVTLGKSLNLSKQGTLNIIHRLCDRDLIQQDSTRREFLRPTEKWLSVVHPLRQQISGKETKPKKNFSSGGGQVSLPRDGAVSLPNSNRDRKTNTGGSFPERERARLQKKGICLLSVRHPRERTLKALESFSDVCEQYYMRPIMKDAEYFAVDQAIDKLHLGDEEYLLRDWVTEGTNKPEFRTNICAAFGYKNLNKWATANNYTDYANTSNEGTIPHTNK